MNKSIILEKKVQSFSEEELTHYINGNAECLSTMCFSTLKKEIILRKDLSNEVKILIENIQDVRNQNFINEIFPYLYSKNKKIKTVEDLIADLKKNEICEPDINTLLRQLPKIIEINNAQHDPENSIKTLGFIFCIVLAIVSFNLFTTSSIIITLISALIGLYLIFNRNDYSRMNKLKRNIEFYLDIIKHIPKAKPEV
ncbi:hypothetical protein V5J73_08045 [Flavobacterium sp. KS-LB2]|uniref:hypothetical protein n=1 Tax=Flavobacterium sp. KS-LB2 TaxID=3120525 RepID=UPI0030D538FB